MVAYEGTRVLITGASGFIGGRLAERLAIEHKARIRALVRDWSRAVWVSRLEADLVPGNVSDRASLGHAVEGCDIVFHCASGGTTTADYMTTNVEGTRNLLEASQAAGVKRFVFVSSIAVHGPSPPDDADETDAYRPWGRGYSDSKIAAEKLVFDHGRRLGLPVVVVRPTFVWGPRSTLFTVRPLLAMKLGTFRLIDEGAGDCHAVYIDNLIDLLIAAGSSPGAAGEAFLATDGYGITWREFFGFYARWLGLPKLQSISSRSWLVCGQAQLVEWSREGLLALQGTPAPVWKRAVRRGVRMLSSGLERRGIPSPWDLAKYARRGHLNTAKSRRLLGRESKWPLSVAMDETENWVRDQLGTELGLGECLRLLSSHGAPTSLNHVAHGDPRS